LIFHGNGDIQRYTGRFTDYLADAKKQAEEEQQQKRAVKKQQTAKSQQSVPSSSQKKKTKLTYAEKLEWDHIDDDLDQLDNKRKSIEEQMTEQSANYQKLAELQKKLDQ